MQTLGLRFTGVSPLTKDFSSGPQGTVLTAFQAENLYTRIPKYIYNTAMV